MKNAKKNLRTLGIFLGLRSKYRQETFNRDIKRARAKYKNIRISGDSCKKTLLVTLRILVSFGVLT